MEKNMRTTYTQFFAFSGAEWRPPREKMCICLVFFDFKTVPPNGDINNMTIAVLSTENRGQLQGLIGTVQVYLYRVAVLQTAVTH
jgi:hypothetical protein